jgi:hypothetical protein
MLPVNFGQLRPLMRFLDTFGILAGAALVVLVLRRLRSHTFLYALRPEMLLLLGTIVSLFSLHLCFNHLNDTYLVSLLPFLLLFVADALRPLQQRTNLLRATTAFSALIILCSDSGCAASTRDSKPAGSLLTLCTMLAFNR